MRNFAYNVVFTLLVVCPVVWLSRQAGLPWWLTGVLAITALAGLWKLLGVQVGVRRRSRHDLERFIQSLLLLRENGGWLDIKHRGSPVRLRIVRVSGDDSTADVVLAVPGAFWSEPKADQVARMFEQQGLSFTAAGGSFAEEPSLIEARVPIASIWNESAGARPARIAHLILDTFDIGPAELLDLRVEGEPSDRWRSHREELVNL